MLLICCMRIHIALNKLFMEFKKLCEVDAPAVEKKPSLKKSAWN